MCGTSLDRYSAHRKAVRLLQDWFEVEWLPAYAPDLNPVEMVWNHSKYSDLANFIPEDVDDLHQAVDAYADVIAALILPICRTGVVIVPFIQRSSIILRIQY